MGRKTGKGTIGAYHALSKKFKWVGWLAVFAPFVIMSFYSVLDAYCIEYLSLNLSNLAFAGAGVMTGGDLFGAMLTTSFDSVVFTLLFMVICYLINRGGVSGGIERFNKVGMPALFVTLMSNMVGWEIKPKTLLDEIHHGVTTKLDGFFTFCIKFIAPLGMLLILAGQLNDFLGLGWF